MQPDDVKTLVRRLWLEAQDVAIGYVIGDRLQAAFEALHVGELEVLAPGEVRDRLRNVAAKPVSGYDGGHLRERKRRCKLSETVIGLNYFAVRGIGVWIGVRAHASMGRVRVVILK